MGALHAGFLVARLLAWLHPTRKAMTRGIGYLQGWAASRDPMSWMELPQVGVMSTSLSQGAVPCGSLALVAVLWRRGMALHPGPSWEAPPTFQAVRRPSRGGPEAWGRVPLAGKMG